MRIDALALVFFTTMLSPSSSSWPAGHLSIPPHLLGPPKASTQGASRYGGWATPVMALVRAISSHPMDALVDVAGGSESGTDGTTIPARLDRRD
jgi:hypothetical protein